MGFVPLAPYVRVRNSANVDSETVSANEYDLYSGLCSNPSRLQAHYVWPNSWSDSTTKTMTDTVTPGFKTLTKQGVIINSPMQKSTIITKTTAFNYNLDCRYTVNTNCGSGVYKDLWFGGVGTGSNSARYMFNAWGLHGWATTPNINVNSLIDTAVTMAWSNADHSKAAALASLGEAKSTIVGLVEIFGRLIKILIAIKKLDFKYLYTQIKPKELANRYMELRYSLRPLYYDAKMIIDAAKHEKTNVNRMTFRGKAKCSDITNQSVVVDKAFDDSTSLMRFTMLRSTKRDVIVKSGLLAQVEEPTLENIWGLDSIAESIWELIPFSFIIDWFFNVGQTIASWTPEAGLHPLASWYVVSDITCQTNKIGSVSLILGSRNYISPRIDPGEAEESIYTELKYRVPDPTRSVLPTFNLKLNTLKLLDLLIIARGIWSGSKRSV